MQWEYTERAAHVGDQQALLAEMGAECWEACGCIQVMLPASDIVNAQGQQPVKPGILFFFKREKAAHGSENGCLKRDQLFDGR